MRTHHSDLLRLLAVAVLLLFTSCKTNSISSVNNTNNDYQTVGPAGARVNGPDGSYIDIPPNALTVDAKIRVNVATDGTYPPLASGVTWVGKVWSFEPWDQTFALDATIALPAPAAGRYDVWHAPPGGAWTSVATVNAGAMAVTTTRVLGFFTLAQPAPVNTVEWKALPPLPGSAASAMVWSTVTFRGKLLVITGTGQLFAFSGGQWTEDTAFATALGSAPSSVFPWNLATAAPGAMGPDQETHLYVSGPLGTLLHADASGTWTKIPTNTTENLIRVATTGFAPNLVVLVVGTNGAALNAGADGVTFQKLNVKVGGVAVTQTLEAIGGTAAGILVGGGAMTLLHFGPMSGNMFLADTFGPGLSTTADIADFANVAQASSIAVDSVGNVLVAAFGDGSMPYTWNLEHTFAQPMHSVCVQKGIVSPRAFAVGEGGQAAIRNAAGMWTTSNTGVTQQLAHVYVDVDPASVTAVGANGTVLQYTGQ